MLVQMTSSNIGLAFSEISDAAHRLSPGGKETAGRYNPAAFTSLAKGRCPAKYNTTYLPVLPVALTSAATAVASGTSWPALRRRSRGSRQGAWLRRQRWLARSSGRHPVKPVKRPGSLRVPTFLVPALSACQHKRV